TTTKSASIPACRPTTTWTGLRMWSCRGRSILRRRRRRRSKWREERWRRGASLHCVPTPERGNGMRKTQTASEGRPLACGLCCAISNPRSHAPAWERNGATLRVAGCLLEQLLHRRPAFHQLHRPAERAHVFLVRVDLQCLVEGAEQVGDADRVLLD